MAQLNFNAKEVPVSSGQYEPLPEGVYTMQIVNSDMKTTKSGDGQYLYLEFDVMGPTHTGRKFFDRLNLFNNNPKTVEIANRQLASICRAVNILALNDSEELHFKPLQVKIKITQSRDGSPQNSATYLAGEAVKAAASSAPAQAEADAGKVKPWERHKK
jgi:hypothetical protein